MTNDNCKSSMTMRIARECKPAYNLSKIKMKTKMKPCFDFNNGEVVVHMLYTDHIN